MQHVLNQSDETRENLTLFGNRFRSGMQTIWRNAPFSNFILPCLVGIVFGILCLVSPLLAVFLGLGFVIFITSLSKPAILSYLVIGAIILTSGIERGRFFPILSGNEVSLLVAVAVTVLIVLTDKRRRVVLPKYFWLAFAVLIGGTVVIPIVYYLQQGTQLTINNAFKMISPIQYFLLFWLFTVLPQGESDRRKIIWCMLGFGFIVAFVGVVQGLGIGFVNRLLEILYASSHEAMAARAGRITSLLGSWNSLGIFMMTIIFICWSVLFEVGQSTGRLLILGIMAISVLCLIATGSYAGIIGTVVGLFFIQILSQRKTRSMPVLIIGLIVIIISVLVFYPFLQPLIEKRLTYQFRYGGMVPQTLQYRIKVWSEIFIPAIRQHFPWPVYPTVPSYYAWQFEESQYILLLFRTGLAGFIGYMTWIAITIGWLYRRFRRSGGFDKSIALAALTLVSVLVIAGFTNEVFSFAGSIDYLWIMLGLVANAMGKI